MTHVRTARPARRPTRHSGSRGVVVEAVIAAALGFGSATVSAYWASGGTGLLDTVGGEIERLGRERSVGVVAALWLITVLKLVIAAAAPAFAGVGSSSGPPAWVLARWTRGLGWVTALGLTLYGAVLAGVGLLIEAGLVDPATDADDTALAWHTYVWDPWFAAWGAAFTLTMWRTRPVGS